MKEETIDWLYGWWERIDEWIEERRIEVGDPLAEPKPEAPVRL
jgi:hypothetical protein